LTQNCHWLSLLLTGFNHNDAQTRHEFIRKKELRLSTSPSLQSFSQTAALQGIWDSVTTSQIEGHLLFTAIKDFVGTKAVSL